MAKNQSVHLIERFVTARLSLWCDQSLSLDMWLDLSLDLGLHEPYYYFWMVEL